MNYLNFRSLTKLSLLIICFQTSTHLFSQDVPITIESGVIPPEFNKENDTLIIAATGNPFYEMSMKRHFKKSYTGNFILAKNYEKYSISTCRYVLFEGVSSKTITTIGGPHNGRSRTTFGHGSFIILDRKTGISYKNPNVATPKLIKAYISGLDLARQT